MIKAEIKQEKIYHNDEFKIRRQTWIEPKNGRQIFEKNSPLQVPPWGLNEKNEDCSAI